MIIIKSLFLKKGLIIQKMKQVIKIKKYKIDKIVIYIITLNFYLFFILIIYYKLYHCGRFYFHHFFNSSLL